MCLPSVHNCSGKHQSSESLLFVRRDGFECFPPPGCGGRRSLALPADSPLMWRHLKRFPSSFSFNFNVSLYLNMLRSLDHTFQTRRRHVHVHTFARRTTAAQLFSSLGCSFENNTKIKTEVGTAFIRLLTNIWSVFLTFTRGYKVRILHLSTYFDHPLENRNSFLNNNFFFFSFSAWS